MHATVTAGLLTKLFHYVLGIVSVALLSRQWRIGGTGPFLSRKKKVPMVDLQTPDGKAQTPSLLLLSIRKNRRYNPRDRRPSGEGNWGRITPCVEVCEDSKSDQRRRYQEKPDEDGSLPYRLDV
jgi:hypothetical protein